MEYRGYIIEIGDNTANHIIRHTGKGSLPKMLSGEWTSVRIAKTIVDRYLASKLPKPSELS